MPDTLLSQTVSRRRLLTHVAGLAAAVTARAEVVQDDPDTEVDFGESIRKLRARLDAQEVEQLEILHIPYSAVFRTNVSTSILQNNFDYKLVVRRAQGSALVGDLVSAAEKTKAEPLGRVCDLRWGFLFMGTRGERVCSIFTEKGGEAAVVNGACVKLQPPFPGERVCSALQSVMR